MRRLITIWLLLALGCVALGQSLGDVARQTRQKQKPKATANKKVITNEDIPESPAQPSSSDAAGKAESTLSADGASKPLTAFQWREKILMQRDVIETLRAKINKLNSSIHFITASESSSAIEYNQYQVKAQQDVKAMQKQLDEEWKKLGDMEEAARKEGMGAALYEP